MDSGAHTLYTAHAYGKPARKKYDYYESETFWNYVDEYIAFLHKNSKYLDVYVNVDVLSHPAKTWEVQRYMEKTGLTPLPVLHPNTDLKWLDRYIKAGHTHIGLGVTGKGNSPQMFRAWGNKIFNDPKYKGIKFHGFAATAFSLLIEYPWYSVDSTTWITHGGYGNVIFPKKKQGKWDYSDPFIIAVTPRRQNMIPLTTKAGVLGNNIETIRHKTPIIFKQMMEYLEENNVDYKELTEVGRVRYDLNGIFYLRMMAQCQKRDDFIFYFSGVGRRAEECEPLVKEPLYDNWGVLISYYHTHHLLKDKEESARFGRIKQLARRQHESGNKQKFFIKNGEVVAFGDIQPGDH